MSFALRYCSPRTATTMAAAAAVVFAGVTSASNRPQAKALDGALGNNGKNSRDNDIVTRNDQYCEGIQIYGIGIKEDPVPGEKRGKGKQHLTSTYWIYDMGVFIQRNFIAMQTMCKYAYDRSEANSSDGYDFRYFMNVSNALFLKAEAEGLRTRDGRDFFLMACWLAMAAAEVDGFPYGKYTKAERAVQRAAFYRKYLSPDVVWKDDEADDEIVENQLGPFAIESCRIDMLPSVALERLGLHNELCALKWSDPIAWMRQGFVVSARFDSMKRHYESVHAQDRTEDHLAHLIWGFMAIVHVIAVFPQMNDLTDFESIRRTNVLNCPDESVRSLVGDGGFRAAGSHGQSAHLPVLPAPTNAIDTATVTGAEAEIEVEAEAEAVIDTVASVPGIGIVTAAVAYTYHTTATQTSRMVATSANSDTSIGSASSAANAAREFRQRVLPSGSGCGTRRGICDDSEDA